MQTKSPVVVTGVLALAALGCALAACGGRSSAGRTGETGGAASPAASRPAPRDIHSHARPEEVRVLDMSLDAQVDFSRRVLEGSVTLRLERAGDGPLRLDTRDLEILRAGAERSDGGKGAPSFSDTAHRFGATDPVLGAELIVDVPPDADLVRIDYRTSPQAAGLQWLDPEQTAGRKHPFVYSQAQAIQARSFVPCQDTPAARATYTARLRVAEPLSAVMAAESKGRSGQEFSFAMPHRIPTYLIAWAAGDLQFAAEGPRTGVWTEPARLREAAAEFVDMERMLESAERLYGPYRWGRYDILVLPPSFPYGGMENPLLTFATPTVLAGDRSLVAVVAHELAHSWSGNLVTNATWADFWLNEGFTTYIEMRIMEEVYGRERAEMEWVLGRQSLDDTLKELADKPDDQRLRVDLAGRDPDEGFTDVPYQKGALLLRLLEESYGRKVFDPFLRSWFDDHAFQSVTTDDFLEFLDARLLDARQPIAGRQRPDVREWVDRPGLPASTPSLHSVALAKVDDQVRRYVEGARAGDLSTAGWEYHHWHHFLSSLPESLTPTQMKELDAAFAFTRTGNAEILEAWLLLAVRHGYEPAYQRLDQFLNSQGRRKFLQPLYKEMVKTDAGKARALATYKKARPMYQNTVRRVLDPIVGWPARTS